jgi:uncharacterized protein YdaU (DUF1376 family)
VRHFAHHIGDYAAATAHLSFMEDAAYRRMLDLYYQTERPLPTDENELMRRLRAVSRSEKNAVRRILTEFFTLSSDGWHQSRADDEIAKYKHLANLGRLGGLKGGRPKRLADPLVGLEATMNQEPRTSKDSVEANASPAAGAADELEFPKFLDRRKVPPRDVIFAECLPWINRRSGKDCRSIVARWCHGVGDDETLRLLEACETENPLDPVAWIVARLKPPETNADKRDREIKAAIAASREPLQ